MNQGTLYLIPIEISDNTADKLITSQLRQTLSEITIFLAENIRTARRFLSSLKIYPSMDALQFTVLDKNTTAANLKEMFAPVYAGRNLGIISEAGCPGIADPGALAVQYAHAHDIRVIPLVGPSSILLALMASGLNGQKFAFHGYLPIDKSSASDAIHEFEKESRKKNQTQIFIETPYRNNAVFDLFIKNLDPSTLLTVAIDITGPQESIHTKKISAWKQHSPSIPKTPAVFLFLA